MIGYFSMTRQYSAISMAACIAYTPVIIFLAMLGLSK